MNLLSVRRLVIVAFLIRLRVVISIVLLVLRFVILLIGLSVRTLCRKLLLVYGV